MSTVVFRTKRLLDFFKVENNWKRNDFLFTGADSNDNEPSVLSSEINLVTQLIKIILKRVPVLPICYK